MKRMKKKGEHFGRKRKTKKMQCFFRKLSCEIFLFCDKEGGKEKREGEKITQRHYHCVR